MQSAHSRAPGRVELLGNHTDYNAGVILSAAINYAVTAAGERIDEPVVRLTSAAYPQTISVPLAGLARQTGAASWTNYPLGVVDCLQKEGFTLGGMQLRFASDLPEGAGLSSSAALEVATACLLKKLFALDLADPMHLAKICRRAENEFAGVSCGLLDQVSSVFGKAGHAIFLDCRSEEVSNLPLPAAAALLVFQSGVPHRLAGGEYNERREQCFAAATALGVSALREISGPQLAATRAKLDSTVFRRAAHVVGENERVFAGIKCLQAGDVAGFGALMFASHESSRTNFENSTPELDTLVELARAIPGVFGSRLTGGGFGGATISLVEKNRAPEIAARLSADYTAASGHRGAPYICTSADGAA
ncbi:MAG: galactokinase [Verrucomicrobia bacterium]|nr:galactokinase [Verrucomicrobiota bacterium]MBV9657158.1 galactokinase [Verrucomicrobiota bacterium]